MMVTYRGCEFYPTTTTTDVGSGRTAPVWEVSGRYAKAAMRPPFLTSARQCREWIRDQDAVAEALREEK